MPIALSTNEQLAGAPVEILELHRRDLSCTQPEPGQQQQDRIVAAADERAAIAARQQLEDRRRLQSTWQREPTAIGNRGHCPSQRKLDLARHMQIAQQRPQPGHELLSQRDAAISGQKSAEQQKHKL